MRRFLFPRSMAWFCTVVALVAGFALDATPDKSDVERAGWTVLEVDFHVHTRFSDGFLSPPGVVVQARRRGLDAIAVTEHNSIFAAQIARTYSAWTGGPTVIVGEEITTNRFHLIGIGLTEPIHWEAPLTELIDAIHAQGGLAIAAHPIRTYWDEYLPVRSQLDASELMHPLAFGRDRSPDNPWRWEYLRDFWVDANSDGYDIAAIGSSDYHFASPLGVCRTWVFAASNSAEDILEAVREGRTVVRDLEGNDYGDPELIASLQAEPLEFTSADYNYHGANVADRVFRTVGWLGLVGLVLLGRRRTER